MMQRARHLQQLLDSSWRQPWGLPALQLVIMRGMLLMHTAGSSAGAAVAERVIFRSNRQTGHSCLYGMTQEEY
jgi:hypothetical protein